jgi:hypothetical protein
MAGRAGEFRIEPNDPARPHSERQGWGGAGTEGSGTRVLAMQILDAALIGEASEPSGYGPLADDRSCPLSGRFIVVAPLLGRRRRTLPGLTDMRYYSCKLSTVLQV